MTHGDVFIKVDPDVTVNHAVTEFPDSDLFGAVSIYADGSAQVRGGCMGVSRAAAQKIVDSGFLRDEKYTGEYFTYVGKHGKVSYQDRIISDVAKRLKLTIADWHDVYAHTHAAPSTAYAFVNEIS